MGQVAKTRRINHVSLIGTSLTSSLLPTLWQLILGGNTNNLNFDGALNMSPAAGIAVLLLSCIGNAELWVILMNRIHAMRYRHHRLKLARYFHDAALLLYPAFLLNYAGVSDNGLLRGGTISDVSVSLQGIIAVTFVGLFPFCYAVMRWTLRQPPTRQLDSCTTVYDVLALAATDAEVAHIKGERPPLLARFPLNQIYQLEVTRKRLRIGKKTERLQNQILAGSLELLIFLTFI